MHHREHDCTLCAFQPATPYTKCVWKNVFTPATTHHAAQATKKSDREAGQSQRDGPEGDHGFTIDVTAVPHHEKYSLQEDFDPGPCTSW